MTKIWLRRFIVCIALTSLTVGAKAADNRLDVYWNDTEGGAATLIVTPAGESILIDTGNPGGRDAQRIFKTASEIAGLKQIDYLIVTHFHIDHFGGAAELSKLIPIRVVYDNGEFTGGRERPSKEYLAFPAERRVMNPGDVLPLKQLEGAPAISFKCIAARQKFVDPPADAKPNPDCEHVRKKLDDGSDNANSIVGVLGFGDFRMYAGGDLTWNVEAKLVCPINLIGKVDVYQVTHHGLDQSNNPVVVKSLAPTVAVFGNGPRKGAEPSTWETIKGADSIQGIYLIHKSASPKGPNIPDEFIANVKTGAEDQGNYIRLSAEADAKSYTVTIPANGHERKFQTISK
ncbi:MAG TPA: MBL fold metallo-hydrolase [Tepidisphaeraceae bacterium]|jgi:beta-lactamase superfamily II metal-dependent hydrolase